MERVNQPLRVRWKQHLGARADQQDACAASSAEVYERKGLLAVLSDGMGGLNRGAVYSKVATETMVSRFRSEPPQADPCTELLGLFMAAQAEALRIHREDNEGGATVVAVLMRNGRCSFLSCGDSRIYLLRGGGLIQLNREHTLGAVLDERAAFGYLPEEEALYNTRRAALTNHLGMAQLKAVDRNLTPFVLLPGDRIALMSDGITNTLKDDVLCRLLQGPFDTAPDQVIDQVIAAAHPKQDNASLLLVGNETQKTRM
ncbi:MAG TPA: serine/threonine-protein phosphatase [Candidatus Limiplasma sp.]|nr:serine/threonine-protein phosphatase [Candidatus Limiplasma sp.]HPS82466.1 serine/threonine-protein phosphatase [Candidatus Limiplasma sp.]